MSVVSRINNTLGEFTTFRHQDLSLILDTPALCDALLTVVDELICEAVAQGLAFNPDPD
jgi:hypothetical protein